ncbi:hypothetical protein FACS189425_01350 [Clostridia bacterium]|nr:hypothetical protein FACS189425_01350 [Clostridia bacterium]
MEYIIKLKDGETTPAPWVNVIANEEFGTVVSESGGGYTWVANSREFKLTEWCNDPILDAESELVIFREDDREWQATRGEREVRHGFGYTVFEREHEGIHAVQTVFVPRLRQSKVTIIHMANKRDIGRKIDIVYKVKPCLGVSHRQNKMHIFAEKEGNAVVMCNNYNSEFAGRRAYITCSLPIDEWEMDDDGCVGFTSSIKIAAGEEREIVLELGSDNAEGMSATEARASLAEVQEFWNEITARNKVDSGDKNTDTLLGGWLIYQTISCRLWARAAFYQCGGAFGFRDQLQDSLNIMKVMPEITREQIIRACKHQFLEGDVQHWWHEPLARGVRTRFSDDLLWLPYCVSEYVRGTGDEGVLDEETNFIESQQLEKGQNERYDIPKISAECANVYEHCVRAIERSLKFGEHGLPLIGSGDWNDGMSNVGTQGKGESVWLAWFLYDVLVKFIPICERKGDTERAKRFAKIAEELKKNTNENAWDGEWYRRAYYDSGEAMGARGNDECEIDAIAQAWAVISGAGDKDKCEKAMQSVLERLVDRENGIIKLLTPAFEKGAQNPGYIKSYVAGVRENGGQYTHAAAWVIWAFYKMGRVDVARELFKMINPLNHADTPEKMQKYKVEPYVISADVYSAEGHEGMGGWSWYTGAAGWMQRVGELLYSLD